MSYPSHVFDTCLKNVGHVTLNHHRYGCDSWGQRTNQVRGVGVTYSNAYTYEKIGQLIGDRSIQSNTTSRLNEQLDSMPTIPPTT